MPYLIEWQGDKEALDKITQLDGELRVSLYFVLHGRSPSMNEHCVPVYRIPVEEALWYLEAEVGRVIYDETVRFKKAFLAAYLRSLGVEPQIPSWYKP